MELAVNMPEHEPQVGQAAHSRALSSSSSIVPAWRLADRLEDRS